LEAIQVHVGKQILGQRRGKSVRNIYLADTRGLGEVPSSEANRRIQGI